MEVTIIQFLKILLNLEYGNGLNTVIKHVFHSDIYTKSNFISYLAPKMCLYFHIVYKKEGQSVQFFWILWIRQVRLI